MTQIVSTQNKTFKITNEMNDSFSYYNVEITVKDLLYESGLHYFDINYNFIFVPSKVYTLEENEKYKIIVHPLYGSRIDDFIIYDGEIIIKNSLTSAMVDYLLMDYSELEKVSGSTTAQKYKQNIMVAINLFWD